MKGRLLDPRALRHALLATAALAGLIVLGSRRLQDFDSAVVGYTFAAVFMVFGIVYRYSVWLSRPATRRFWRRGWEIVLRPARWPGVPSLRLLAGGVGGQLLAQDFIFRRSRWRWVGHALMVWGCLLAAAVTFPLVFGWLHFELGATGPVPTYRVVVFGFPALELPLGGVLAFATFHALVLSAFLVIPGVMIAMWRRLRDPGTASAQRFAYDLLPLLELFAVSITGLMLWVSYTWLEGYFFGAVALLHAVAVIGTLLHLSFGKLFHVFQRPASLGVVLYRAAGARGEQTRCPVTGEAFASGLQTGDLGEVLVESGLAYGLTGDGPGWHEVSPRGRRILVGLAQGRTLQGRFR